MLLVISSVFWWTQESVRPCGCRLRSGSRAGGFETRKSICYGLFHWVSHARGWMQVEWGGTMGYVPAWVGWPYSKGDFRTGFTHWLGWLNWTSYQSGCSFATSWSTCSAELGSWENRLFSSFPQCYGQPCFRSRTHAGGQNSAFPGGEGSTKDSGFVFILRSCGSHCCSMPSKRQSPSVVSRLLTGGIAFEKSSLSATLLPVRLQWATSHHNCFALLDSGAEGNFLDITLAHQLMVPVIPLIQPISVNALGGQALPSVTHSTGAVSLTTSDNHQEEIHFMLIDSPCSCSSWTPLA